MVTQVQWLSLISLVIFLMFSACTAVPRNTTHTIQPSKDVTQGATMNKDALRLSVRILALENLENGRNVYRVSVEKIVKYGATFSSVAPKAGEVVMLSTAEDVTFQSGDVILMDVLTPRIDDGERPMQVRLA